MRSPIWFVVAGVIVVASFAGAAFFLMPALADIDARMMRVVVPGDSLLVFDQPGSYVIFHEKRSVVDGRYYESDSVNGLQLGLTSGATGARVKLVEPSTTTNYTIGNRSGVSIYAFTLEQAGRYRLSASLAGGNSKAVLAIGQGLLGDMMRLIFGAIAIVAGGFAAAGAIVLAVVWQRSRAKRPT
jgi:hypothetical protein